MSLVINPTIGRRVLLFIASATTPGVAVNNPAVPFDAGIAFVHGTSDSDSMINCGYTDHNGVAHHLTSVRLMDLPQAINDKHGTGQNYAVWMDYQWQQAHRAQARG